MEYDDRERRDPSAEDDRSTLDEAGTAPDPGTAQPPDRDPDATSTWDTPPAPESAATDATRATASGDAVTEEAAPAEIESWPSQEPTTAEPVGSSPFAAEPSAAIPSAEPAWPTEPPVAGSGTEDTWPTDPPERGDEPILGPDWQSTEPAGAEAQAAEPDVPDALAAPVEPMPAESSGWGTDPAPTEFDAPPPSEVEAYPAAPAPADAGIAAGAVPAHSVPDGSAATGESTQCPRCGTENRPGLAFCRNCGQRLVAAGVASTVERPGTPEGTQSCPRCGTHNRSGVAFCQNCGANLRGTAEGYVPPAVAGDAAPAAVVPEQRGAVLGPIVLLIGLIGLVTAYLLPFAYGPGSLSERAWGSGGYGASFWSGYPQVEAALADQAYFGLAAPVPLLGLLLVVLAVAGFVRAAPGMLQTLGLAVALLWSAALAILFVVVELAANWNGDIVDLLRLLTPAGIIFFLSALIVLIGTLTRFARS